MPEQDTLDQLKDHLASAQSVVVLLNAQPSFDQIAASLALAESLQAAGKEVTTACPVDVSSLSTSSQNSNLQSLQNIELIQQKLGNQNLSIKFPYQADSVDKVSYHISDDNETFYLIIKPQKGTKPLDASKVSFDYTGANADMVFMVGIHELESLEHLYEGYEELYSQATIVSLHTFETEIGHLKIDVSKHTTYSEALVSVLQHLELPVSGVAASNLLAGIEVVTKSFTSPLTTADTFEVVAQLMRQGARRPRLQVAKPTNGASQVTVGDFSAALSAKPTTIKKKVERKVAPKAAVEPEIVEGEVEGPVVADVGGLDYQPGAEGGLGRG